MKYCVFCAANIPENQDSIDIALRTVDILQFQWLCNADIHGVYEGSQFTVNHNDGNNTSVWAEDDDISRLIHSCMLFATEGARQIYKNTNKKL